jgi:putative copper resistance protein D
VLIAEPLWAEARAADEPLLLPHRRQATLIMALGLALALASGAVQLLLIVATVTEEPWTDTLRDGTAWTFLTETHFGRLAQLRLSLAILLAGLLTFAMAARSRIPAGLRALNALLSAALLGSLAFTGHAADGVGAGANLHLASDLLHTLAAGAWLGGLVPLVLLLRLAARHTDTNSLGTCARTLQRFSILGVACVTALAATGFINTWYLTDHLRELFGTEYGQLVQIKIVLFLAMLGLAAFNRFRLAPRIAQTQSVHNSGRQALRRLQLSAALEIVLGCLVIYVVGVLGMTAPTGHHHD